MAYGLIRMPTEACGGLWRPYGGLLRPLREAGGPLREAAGPLREAARPLQEGSWPYLFRTYVVPGQYPLGFWGGRLSWGAVGLCLSSDIGPGPSLDWGQDLA